MLFALDSEQQLLSDSVARFVQNTYAFETRQRRLAAGETSTPDIWRIFADNGWLAAALPEAYGGLGGGVIETTLICQQLGRGLVLEPYLASAVLAAQAFNAGASDAQRAAWIPALADGSRRLALAYSEPTARGAPHIVETRAKGHGREHVLSGGKSMVLGGPGADAYVVSAKTDDGLGLFLVAANEEGLTRKRAPLHDGTVAEELEFNAAKADVLGETGQGLAALREGLAHATLALGGELIGCMEQAIEITASYLRTRHQFGVALASFQVLQHRMADMAAELELARSMQFAALASFANDDVETRTQTLGAAKAWISRAALSVCGQAIQLHGGIGMTEEYRVGHYFKRAVVASAILGANAMHEAACAAALQRRIRTGKDRPEARR